jgi:SAM-dependent methyltransferase
LDLDVEWLDDNHLRIGDARFDLFFAERTDDRPRPGVFLLEKSREMVEFYRERFGTLAVGTMVELGIRWGASVALFHRLLSPKKFVAIDIVTDAPPGLVDYIRANRAEASLRPRFGIDQGDAAAVRRVLAEEIGDEPLDLVIDDGCHWLTESRTAFNTLFPRVRPGGTYVLEDWGWAHWPAFWQDHGGPWLDRPSLTQLVFEFVMTTASRADVVASVEVGPALALVRRGPARLDEGFDISRSYLTAGRRFVELGPPKTSVGRARVRLIRRLRRAVALARTEGVRAVLAKLIR